MKERRNGRRNGRKQRWKDKWKKAEMDEIKKSLYSIRKSPNAKVRVTITSFTFL